jgi:multidrug transporter EmrE-like cation transporter
VTEHLGIFLVGVFLAAAGQVLMKKGASRSRNRRLVASFLDPYTLAGYLLMFTSTITSTIALKVLPLKLTVSLLPLGYVTVVMLSLLVLGERMRRNQFWGMAIILAGIVLFNQGSR